MRFEANKEFAYEDRIGTHNLFLAPEQLWLGWREIEARSLRICFPPSFRILLPPLPLSDRRIPAIFAGFASCGVEAGSPVKNFWR
jgi:hypothetical protein